MTNWLMPSKIGDPKYYPLLVINQKSIIKATEKQLLDDELSFKMAQPLDTFEWKNIWEIKV